MTDSPRLPQLRPTRVWRAPDGGTWQVVGTDVRAGIARLVPAVQDPDTGRWSTVRDGARVEVPVAVAVAVAELRARYVEVPPERLRDPRITRLTSSADAITAALDEVSWLPEEARRRASRAARLGARRSTWD
jgi:hypothetical protein